MGGGSGCSVADCGEKLVGRGLCGRHYARLRRTGTTEVGVRLVGAPLEQRLWFRTQVVDGCWVSARALTRRVRDGDDGYPGLRVGGAMVPVHRAAYELLVGVIPDGHHVHHRCGVKRCWRPEHLVALDPVAHKGAHHKEACVNGHALTEENTKLWISPQGWTARACRECRREGQRRRRARRELVAS